MDHEKQNLIGCICSTWQCFKKYLLFGSAVLFLAVYLAEIPVQHIIEDGKEEV